MQLRVEVPLPRGAEMVMLDNARQLRPVLGLTDAVRAMVPVNEPVPVAVIVDVPAASCTPGLITRLKGLLRMYPGRLAVIVRLVGEGDPVHLRLGDEFAVDGEQISIPRLDIDLGDLPADKDLAPTKIVEVRRAE